MRIWPTRPIVTIAMSCKSQHRTLAGSSSQRTTRTSKSWPESPNASSLGVRSRNSSYGLFYPSSTVRRGTCWFRAASSARTLAKTPAQRNSLGYRETPWDGAHRATDQEVGVRVVPAGRVKCQVSGLLLVIGIRSTLACSADSLRQSSRVG